MKKILNFIWKIITLPLKGLDLGFGKYETEYIEELEESTEADENETKNVYSQNSQASNYENSDFSLYSFYEKYSYARELLAQRYRNYALAEIFVSLIDTCDTHDEKCKLVMLFIENFCVDPEKLKDQVQEETAETMFRLERLAASHFTFIKALVYEIMLNKRDELEEFSDYFTRVVFANPSIFSSKIERAYALFRGTWLWHSTYIIYRLK